MIEEGGISFALQAITPCSPVKDEREDALAACGGLSIPDGCARRDPEDAGNPAQV